MPRQHVAGCSNLIAEHIIISGKIYSICEDMYIFKYNEIMSWRKFCFISRRRRVGPVNDTCHGWKALCHTAYEWCSCGAWHFWSEIHLCARHAWLFWVNFHRPFRVIFRHLPCHCESLLNDVTKLVKDSLFDPGRFSIFLLLSGNRSPFPS